MTNILALLAHLPALLPNPQTHLFRLKQFYERTLQPRLLRGSSGNGLLRKMGVKARGRWWVALLGVTMGEAGRVRRSARGRRAAPGEFWMRRCVAW